jgi:hypothetical protein
MGNDPPGASCGARCVSQANLASAAWPRALPPAGRAPRRRWAGSRPGAVAADGAAPPHGGPGGLVAPPRPRPFALNRPLARAPRIAPVPIGGSGHRHGRSAAHRGAARGAVRGAHALAGPGLPPRSLGRRPGAAASRGLPTGLCQTLSLPCRALPFFAFRERGSSAIRGSRDALARPRRTEPVIVAVVSIAVGDAGAPRVPPVP